MKNCTLLWREAHFEITMLKTLQLRSTFGRVAQKVHAVVARSIFGSQMLNNYTFRPLLEVEMSKKRTLLWPEAHFEVKHVENTTVLEHFWKKSVATSARRWHEAGFEVKILKTCLDMFGPLLDVQASFFVAL
jgi:hypothetical protein